VAFKISSRNCCCEWIRGEGHEAPVVCVPARDSFGRWRTRSAAEKAQRINDDVKSMGKKMYKGGEQRNQKGLWKGRSNPDFKRGLGR